MEKSVSEIEKVKPSKEQCEKYAEEMYAFLLRTFDWIQLSNVVNEKTNELIESDAYTLICKVQGVKPDYKFKDRRRDAIERRIKEPF